MKLMKDTLLERFSKYLSYPTTSDENSTSYPSTQALLDFGDVLADELKAIGMQEAGKDPYGYVTALLPDNTGHENPTVGFIAHFDTAPDMPGIAAPRIIENYDGKDILLDAETHTVLTPDVFPELTRYKGQTLLTTDGKTLLGADDKAGIAEIVTTMEYLAQHPEIKHGPLKVAFTPDEEIGNGVKYFDVAKFGCDFAYTIDGGGLGELEYENFNAASATVEIQGRNVHPGYAKNIMVNSQLIAMEFNSMLPEFARPQYTEGYEGFYLLLRMEGTVEHSRLKYIIRDHDRQKFETMKQYMLQTADFLNKKHGNCITCNIEDQYYNMREMVEPAYHVVERALKAFAKAGIKPLIQPVRGGTDGANLSFKGLPCPNIFAGGHNFHGKYEYVPVESMVKAVEVILNIAQEQ